MERVRFAFSINRVLCVKSSVSVIMSVLCLELHTNVLRCVSLKNEVILNIHFDLSNKPTDAYENTPLRKIA
jgi:hypothetical protein